MCSGSSNSSIETGRARSETRAAGVDHGNTPTHHSPADGMAWPRSTPIGLLAGSGRFPIVFAQKARSLGIPVVCVGLRHEADPALARLVEHFDWVGIAQLGRMIRCF